MRRLLFPLALGFKTLMARSGRLSPHLRGSMVGIGLSLIPFVVVLEISAGMIEGITRRYLELGTYHLQITPPDGWGLEETRAMAGALEGLPAIRRLAVERQGLGLLYSKAARSGVSLRAVPPSLYAQDADFRQLLSLPQGSFDLAGKDAVLLGSEVASRLGVGVGDTVKLLTAVGKPGRQLPRVSALTVRGIFGTGYLELDKLWAFLPLESGERLLDPRTSRLFVGVKVENPFSGLEATIKTLERSLPPGARISTWHQLERASYRSFQTTKALLLFIMALIVLVAAVNVSSALVMVVLEKTQEIGILKSMGARPGQITLAFTFTGFLTGAAGSLLGLSLGLLAAVRVNELIRALDDLASLLLSALGALGFPLRVGPEFKLLDTSFYLERIPIRIPFAELLGMCALTLLISVLASYFPARGAAGIRPMETLRKH